MDDLPAASPMPMAQQTPFIYNASNTPLLGRATESPFYNAGQTSFHPSNRPSSSQIRSPSYLYQNSASSSPNYSSLQSRSPDYNSPLGSSGRLGNSPNYSPSPIDPNRGQFKAEEDNDYDEDEVWPWYVQSKSLIIITICWQSHSTLCQTGLSIIQIWTWNLTWLFFHGCTLQIKDS